MPPEVIIGALATVITSLAGVTFKMMNDRITDLKEDNKFWRDRSLSGQDRVDKALDTLQEALTLVREQRARGGNR